MFIDLSKLEELGSKQEIKGEINFDQLSFQKREIKIPEPLKIDLVVFKSEDGFIFSGQLKGNVLLECSRCLDEFSLKLDVDVNQEVELSEIQNLDHFDLKHLLKPDLFLAIPIKPLCSEDCQGLCPQCGQDLNQTECDCTVDDVDPRMAKLKDLYEDD